MTFVPTSALALLLGLFNPEYSRSQDRSPSTQPQGQFFSGVVLAATKDSVTVNRTVPGRNPETRTFSIDSGTRIEGALRVHARVTVRHLDGRAIHVIVRPPRK